MRCHIAAFSAMGGAVEEILYDRMKTAVTGEDEAGVVSCNAALVALLNHYGTVPRACQPCRTRTKGKVERPFRYIRQDFFLGCTFRNMDDLNAQFDISGGSALAASKACSKPSAISAICLPRRNAGITAVKQDMLQLKIEPL